MKSPHIVVVGGGFSGVSFVVQCARRFPSSATFTVIEPRTELGRGIAFSAAHPAHRLNAPDAVHVVDPANVDDFPDWLDETGTLTHDPKAMQADGTNYIRRGTFGEYVRDRFERARDGNLSRSDIRHFGSPAVQIEETEDGLAVTVGTGGRLDADVVVVATGNEPPARIPHFDGKVGSHPAYLADPWKEEVLASIAPDEEVLLVGSALTAADVIASLLSSGHTGAITSISRTGLLPARRPAPNPARPGLAGKALASMAWDQITRADTLFVQNHGSLDRVSEICRALRTDIAAAEAEGLPWQGPFDDLRDSVRAVWPRLAIDEKRRFLRHLRRWYDAHRFRLPPQLERLLDDAEERGQLSFITARIQDAGIQGDRLAVTLRERVSGQAITRSYSRVLNCTGPSNRPDQSENPFVRSLLAKGLARPHPTGLGFDVDADCRAIRADGKPLPSLVFLGALTLGAFGEPLATPWIAAQISRLVPGLISQLQPIE
ncbi:FAD/NAD(P)-binding protein [bacterium]|nr:FAD/NAD(P)-binding protein [bacterium]